MTKRYEIVIQSRPMQVGYNQWFEFSPAVVWSGKTRGGAERALPRVRDNMVERGTLRNGDTLSIREVAL